MPDPGRHFVDQIVIVRHQQYRSRIFLKGDIERIDRFQVQVIGGLIEHQEIRTLQHQPAEDQPRRLAARERLGRLQRIVPAEQHLPEQPPQFLLRSLRIELMQPLDHGRARRDRTRIVLREVTDRHFVPPLHGAAVDLEIAGPHRR